MFITREQFAGTTLLLKCQIAIEPTSRVDTTEAVIKIAILLSLSSIILVDETLRTLIHFPFIFQMRIISWS
jgi:hypothetical protein